MDINYVSRFNSSVDFTDLPSVRSGRTVQKTSIDGFFNRKRGRPPKNRFVEVYKNAQPSPQAIFTSFKLEKTDESTGVIDIVSTTAATCPAATTKITTARETTANFVRDREFQTSNARKRKHNKISTTVTSSQTSEVLCSENQQATKDQRMKHQEDPAFTITTTLAKSAKALETTSNKSLTKLGTTNDISAAIHNQRIKSSYLLTSNKYYDGSLFNSETRSQPVDNGGVSVVRAAGTFFPENSIPESATSSRKKPQSSADSLINVALDQPEDLSMKPIERNASEQSIQSDGDCEIESNTRLQQLKQFLSLYHQQLLFPARTDHGTMLLHLGNQEGPNPDGEAGRTLIENNVSQKLLLFNMMATAATTLSTVFKSNRTMTEGCSVRRIRDNSIPTGYLKYRFNEDCGFEHCGYRNHQSHFHCNRSDCQYSFCDKSRFVQHSARHERLDTLMGEDFQQYRSNMFCCYTDCPYSSENSTKRVDSDFKKSQFAKKNSHFHCRKCDYVCADTNKVVAHRRLHTKMEYIRSVGFRKVSSNEPCSKHACSYGLKQTHYHCLSCDCSVLTRSQLISHKHKISTF